MDNPKRTRTRDHETPTIGDDPGRNAPSGGSEAWRLDPSDVARHARLRRRSEQRGPFGKVVRYAAVVLALGGGFAVYWNFDTLRNVTVDVPALSALLKSPSGSDATAPASNAPGNEKVESLPVLGAAAPTSVSAHDRERPLEVAKVEPHRTPAPVPREAPASERPPAVPSASVEQSSSTEQSAAAKPSVAAPTAVEPPPPPQP